MNEIKINSDETVDENQNQSLCTPDSVEYLSCSNEIPNALSASRTRTCNSEGEDYTYSLCNLISCINVFEKDGNDCSIQLSEICTANFVDSISCTHEIANALSASKSRTCSSDGLNYTYGTCILSSCSNGYEPNGNSCSAIIIPTYTSITLSWTAPTQNIDNSSLTNLSGHKIKYGTSSGVYQNTIDVGNVTTHTVQNLERGQTYFFVATAYNLDNIESDNSTELTIAIPAQ